MLIEAAKGGHTNVVSILIDYPTQYAPMMPAEETNPAVATPSMKSGPRKGRGQQQQQPAQQQQQGAAGSNNAAGNGRRRRL